MIALATSDWQIDDHVPAYRKDEPDWREAMLRPISQIKALQRKYNCPILFGGDLFDKAEPKPETINWLLKHCPIMYSIAGNHDLPNHRYADIEKSGYWTMVEAGRLIDLKPSHPHPLEGLTVHGFPFGTEIRSIASNMITGFNVALIHSYVWKKSHGYTGAPADKRVGQWEAKLTNFSHAFLGDNHSAFGYKGKHTTIINTGCIMRRRRDEANYEPRVWLLWSDGEVSEEFLDCSADIYVKGEEVAESKEVDDGIDTAELIEVLERLNKRTKIDFVAGVNEMLTALKVRQGVREKVAEALEGER